MPYTITNSITTSYTEARANYVIGKVEDDMYNMYARGLVTVETIQDWKNHILFLMRKQVLSFFEFQFSYNGVVKRALRFDVEAMNCVGDDFSGGVDYYSLPSDTCVSVLFSFSKEDEEVKEYTKNWGTSTSLQGTGTSGNIYSKDGFGIKQTKIGW